MLFGAVVVGAVGRGHVHAVGVVIGAHDEIRTRLARGIGGVGRIGRGFGKESGFTQGAVHLIRGNVVEACVLIARLHLARGLHPVAARGFNKGEGAHKVGFHEGAGALDGVVHMAFRRKMNNAPDVVFGEQLLNKRLVADIPLHKGIVGQALAFLQVVGIARIGELVEIDDVIIRVLFAEVRYKVGSDESGSAGDENGGHDLSC